MCDLPVPGRPPEQQPARQVPARADELVAVPARPDHVALDRARAGRRAGRSRDTSSSGRRRKTRSRPPCGSARTVSTCRGTRRARSITRRRSASSARPASGAGATTWTARLGVGPSLHPAPDEQDRSGPSGVVSRTRAKSRHGERSSGPTGTFDVLGRPHVRHPLGVAEEVAEAEAGVPLSLAHEPDDAGFPALACQQVVEGELEVRELPRVELLREHGELLGVWPQMVSEHARDRLAGALALASGARARAARGRVGARRRPCR